MVGTGVGDGVAGRFGSGGAAGTDPKGELLD